MMSGNTIRLYHDLAWLWPMWGNPEDPEGEYVKWCEYATQLIRSYSKRDMRTLLNMGCGGGKNIFTLKKHFKVTGIDLSRDMLELARKLNPEPECTFLQADMRDSLLGKEFDAIVVDDAITYMTGREELASVFLTAYKHLGAGGVMVTMPDVFKENFQQNFTRVTHADTKLKQKNVDVVFIENYYDQNPDDETFEGTMLYLIRENGTLRIEYDHHKMGVFSLDVWRTILHEVGFDVHEDSYRKGEDHFITFVCVKP